MPDAFTTLGPDIAPDILQQTVLIQTLIMPDFDYIFGTASLSVARNIYAMNALDNVYIHIPVVVCIDNITGQAQDPSLIIVKIAVVTIKPVTADFQTATWALYTGNTLQNAPIFARLGIGPLFNNALIAGIYTIYISTNGAIRPVGTLTVT